MMLDVQDILLAANAFADAANNTAKSLEHDDVAGEEDFSGQMIGEIKGEIRRLKTPNTIWETASSSGQEDKAFAPRVTFRSRQLTSKGGGAEETWSGADIVIVVNIKAYGYSVDKGVLAQAKILKRGALMAKDDFDRLQNQCTNMTSVTSASFVILYSASGVDIISASAVLGTTNRRLHQLVRYQSRWLFEDLLTCWHGDVRLQATDRKSLAALRDEVHARNALLIKATSKAAGDTIPP